MLKASYFVEFVHANSDRRTDAFSMTVRVQNIKKQLLKHWYQTLIISKYTFIGFECFLSRDAWRKILQTFFAFLY